MTHCRWREVGLECIFRLELESATTTLGCRLHCFRIGSMLVNYGPSQRQSCVEHIWGIRKESFEISEVLSMVCRRFRFCHILLQFWHIFAQTTSNLILSRTLHALIISSIRRILLGHVWISANIARQISLNIITFFQRKELLSTVLLFFVRKRRVPVAFLLLIVWINSNLLLDSRNCNQRVSFE